MLNPKLFGGVRMTYDRLKAKKIPGEHCRFCGNDSVPLVKTKCCNQWICCDTSFASIEGGGYCQYPHEHESICHFHYNNGHSGIWQECEECRDLVGDDNFKTYFHDPNNVPRY